MGHLSISLMGPFAAQLDREPVAGFQSNKVRALLAFLALEMPYAHPRQTLCGLLWPEVTESRAHHNLNQALCNLRHTIGDCDAPPVPTLIATTQTIQFNCHSDHWLDVAEFERLTGWATTPSRPSSDLAALRQAVTLYRGPFLDGFSLDDSAAFETWIVLQRERLHQLALDALRCLADVHAAAGEMDEALYYARRQLQLDPWLEEAHLQIMRCLARSGRRSEALVQYGICRRILAQELGVEPAEETVRLYEELRNRGMGVGD